VVSKRLGSRWATLASRAGMTAVPHVTLLTTVTTLALRTSFLTAVWQGITGSSTDSLEGLLRSSVAAMAASPTVPLLCIFARVARCVCERAPAGCKPVMPCARAGASGECCPAARTPCTAAVACTLGCACVALRPLCLPALP
jgi:hypothetical protein